MKIVSLMHKVIFSAISLIYTAFFPMLWRKYRKVINTNKAHLGPESSSILDIGCGTGAFTYALTLEGYRASGTDISGPMMLMARKKKLNCVKGDILEGLPFEDKSFDTVTAAFVAHGMRGRLRREFYSEAFRIAKNTVIIHDYQGRHAILPVLLIEILELLIGADYFGFRKNVMKELSEYSDDIQTLAVTESSGWYICKV